MHDSPAVLIIMALTCGISFWAFEDPAVEERYLFRPERILAGKEYYRLLSSAFVHSGWAHLLLNMYTLYGFARVIAAAFGETSFLVIYLGSVLGGNLLALYLHRNHDYAAYGASGGVCGIIFAFVVGWPHSRMALFPLPYALPAWLYAIAFMIASFYAMKAQTDNIGHDAHLGGAIVGLLLTALMKPELLRTSWLPFSALLGLSVLVLAYVWINPLMLPLSGANLLTARSSRRMPAGQRRGAGSRHLRRDLGRPARANAPEKGDWLLEQIELQVGTLLPDQTRQHAWIDRFGRSYGVVAQTAATFDLGRFTAEVLRHLESVEPNFVIVDTRELTEAQVDALRPFFAQLPEAQFHRVLRSYAFKGRSAA